MHLPRVFLGSALGLAVSLAGSAAQADRSNTSPEQAYDLGELQTPRALGMGGAVNAIGTSTTSLFANPGNMTGERIYHIEGLASLVPEAGRQSYGAAIVDSVLNKNHIAGGLAGSWSILDPNGLHRAWTDVRVGAAYPISDRLSLGVITRYVRVDQSVGTGPFGASLASDGTSGSPVFNQITFDAGMSALITQNFRFGVVGHNLTNPGTALVPTTLASGLGFVSDVFSAELGGLVDFTTWGKARLRGMVGAEVFLADRVKVRLGYRYDDGSRTHAVSGGLGYVDKKWGLELGARRDVVADHPATFLTLSLRYFHNAEIVPDQPDTF